VGVEPGNRGRKSAADIKAVNHHSQKWEMTDRKRDQKENKSQQNQSD
jgi:hypothetical protein